MNRRRWVSYSKASGILVHMIREGSHLPKVLDKSASIVSDISPINHAAQAQALWNFVRNGVLYLEDPYREDVYQSPDVTIQRRAGDCDDQAILLGSLLRSIGFPVRLVFVFKTPPKNKEAEFPAHVYLEVDVNKSELDPLWVCAETIPMPDDQGGFVFATFGRTFPRGFREVLPVN